MTKPSCSIKLTLFDYYTHTRKVLVYKAKDILLVQSCVEDHKTLHES